MRGCLFTLGFGALFAVVLAWVALPPLAGALVAAGLDAGGFETAGGAQVEVQADPPLTLLSGRADAVVIVAEDATFGELEAGRAELTLAEVDILGRSFERIEGQLDRATVRDADGDVLRARLVRLDGPASRVDFEIVVAPDEVTERVRAALADEIGTAPDDVTLEPPDRIGVRAGALSFGGRLVLTSAGALVLDPDVGVVPTLELFDPTDDATFELTSVGVAGGELVIRGTLDATTLLD